MNRTQVRGGGDQYGGGNRGSGNRGYSGGNRANFNGNLNNFNYNPPRRDLESDMLSAINAEFQIHCTDYRSIDDIFHRIEQDQGMYNYIQGKKEVLIEFLNHYGNNFYINPERPEIVQWRKEQRLVAKNDRKEPKREARRQWAKEYDESSLWYDIVNEQNVLRFILSLFTATRETWLRMDLVQKAVKQALRVEADLDDYVGGDVRAFVVKRDYLFKEHMDMLLFHGINAADVACILNEEVRENSYQAINRVPFRRLHKFYLETPTISDQARQELNMNEAKDFLQFIKRSAWIFTMDTDDTHVVSKRMVPALPWKGPPLERHFKEIVDLFKQMHNREEHGGDDDVTSNLDPDDVDDGYSAGGRTNATGKQFKKKQRVPSSLSERSSVMASNPFADDAGSYNGHREVDNGHRDVAAARPQPLDDLSDFLAAGIDEALDLDEDNPWSKYH